jgi:3-methyladenine DNA glycosylase AlkD
MSSPSKSAAARTAEALAWLGARGSAAKREQMLTRYGITAPKSFGVSMGDIQSLAKRLGRDHELAAALWETEWYEARLLCAYVDDPQAVTLEQMERWARAFDNWAVCDTLCFALFDRTPHAWRKIEQWSTRREEFVKRAAFALLASVALHDKRLGDAPFLEALQLIDRAADDERNFVKKGVSWALRGIGRRSAPLCAAALALAHGLAASADPTRRWIGKDALRDLDRRVTAHELPARRSSRTAVVGSRRRKA